MSKIKCILFDIGGVLVDWHMSWITSEIAKRFEINEVDVVESFGNYLPELDCGKIKEKTFWEKIANDTNSSLLAQTTESLWNTYFQKNAKINHDVLSLVSHLKGNYSLGIISNIEEITHKIVHDWSVLDNFTHRFLSYQIGFSKPDVRIYEHVLDSLPFEGQDMVFIDDKPSNVESAQKCGINSIHFTNYAKLRKSLQDLEIEIGKPA
ncbi:MAG: HAD family phosphatase [Nitrosopumilaceae archaeon]|nr:HAD family phosphatase [Nitrosopumilaceae archaeon]